MTLELPIYMDYNATTPLDQRVWDTMVPYFLKHFGNAASDHEFGSTAFKGVEKARGQIATLIGVKNKEDIIFTSGATESDNLALFGIAEHYADKGDHIITCITEHKAVLDTAERLRDLGKKVTFLPVDSYGMVAPEDVRRAITPHTILISIMAANNEIGTIPNLKEIGTIAREHGVFFHVDGAQYVGHLPLDVNEHYIDLLSISSHKMYGPKGIGALFVRRDNPWVKVEPIIYGGKHERGMRSGTLNVPAIVGFGTAAELCQQEMYEEEKRLRTLTKKMLDGISAEVEGVELNGHPSQRLPHNLNISIKNIKSRTFVISLKDISISAGSACTTAQQVEYSYVVYALGYGEKRAASSLRLSIGRFTTEEEVDYATDYIISKARRLQKIFHG